jgi:UDP-glucose:(glucosyl)LPS alpha-1,2-glucosyltransferase
VNALDARRRVAIVLPPYEGFAPSSAGAIGLLVHRLSAWPGAFDPVVIGPEQADLFDDIVYRPSVMPWFPPHPMRRYEAGVARAIKAVRPALIEVHNRPDIALWLQRRFRDIPVVAVMHNDRQQSVSERSKMLAQLARVVAVSRFVRDRLLEGLAMPLRPPSVLENCLDLRQIPPSPFPRERTILFAGRVVADKGADAFVAACARALPALPGWRGELIGADRFGPRAGTTAFLRALQLQADAAGIATPGYLPHEQVLAAMARAAIVVIPSRWPEPFGLTALEALACGAALITSGRGGLREVVGDAAALGDPDDVAGLAGTIVALAEDPGRQAALGTAGRSRAAMFDVAQAAVALDALRTDVLTAWSSAVSHPI